MRPGARDADTLALCSLVDHADDSTRIACGEDRIGHISCYDASRSYHGPRADSYAGENNRAPAQPHI